MAGSRNVVFDVVGTLVSYDRIFEAIDTRLGDRLRAECIKPTLLGYTWLEATEREYTYLSMSDRYLPFAKCFESLWYRMLWMAGIQKPREFCNPEDLAYIMAEYQLCDMRPGARECVAKLREAGFTVWALTAGDRKRVGGYFANAGIDLPEVNLLSCDSTKVGKPAPESYRPLLETLKAAGGNPWFAAAHMWDVSAARSTGFKGAYCSVWENEPLHELFGEMDVEAPTLPEMADMIIAVEAKEMMEIK